jgi:hypothetical protein
VGTAYEAAMRLTGGGVDVTMEKREGRMKRCTNAQHTDNFLVTAMR